MPRDDTKNGETATLEVQFTPGEYERLNAVADEAGDIVHEAAMDRVELYEAIEFTRDGGFRGPSGFARIKDDAVPTWPLGSLLGIELRSMGDGESRWIMDVGPEHANPMGTIHGGVLCDLGDAALSTAYMSTLDADELFSTVNLTVHFLRPVRSARLEAVGEVVHRGRSIGVAESEITTQDGALIARLSGTCMTIGNESSSIG